MSLPQDLEIYKAADALLALSLSLQAQIPRAFRQAVGQRISNECAEILLTVARANAARGASREAHITEWLPANLGGTRINPAKTILQPINRGVDFVGHIIKPWRRTTRPRTVAAAVQRLRTMPEADVFAAGNSYLGLLGQASHSLRDRATVAKVLMGRGHAVSGKLTKIYRRAKQNERTTNIVSRRHGARAAGWQQDTDTEGCQKIRMLACFNRSRRDVGVTRNSNGC